MPSLTGTHTINDLLAVQNQSVAAFGEDRAAEIMRNDLDAWNAMIRSDLLPELVDPTADRQRVSGVSTRGVLMEVTEFSRAPTQKLGAPPTVGFPLRRYDYPLGWTRDYLQRATPADLARTQIGQQIAHLERIRYEIQRAMFNTANYSFTDRFVDSVALAVKRLANADGMAIPNGPYGASFDASTHTHYLANAGLTAAFLTATIDTVMEHGVTGPMRVAVNVANEAAVRALTGFVALQYPYITPASSADAALAPRLNMLATNNRQIGFFGPAEVWVKPWAITGYAVAYDAGDGREPLALRQRAEENLQGLRMIANIDAHPLRADYYLAEFGVGVWNRTSAAILDFVNASYTAPTLTLPVGA
jgi:hypothetical protein